MKFKKKEQVSWDSNHKRSKSGLIRVCIKWHNINNFYMNQNKGYWAPELLGKPLTMTRMIITLVWYIDIINSLSKNIFKAIPMKFYLS